MKKVIPFLFASALALYAQSSFTQETSSAPYSANYLSANQTGQLWVFGEGGSHGEGLYTRFNNWEYIPYDLSKGVIAASSKHGEILIVNNAGELKEWNNNNKRWLSYTGISGVTDACISQKNGNQKYALGKVKVSDGSLKYGLWRVDNISTSASSWESILTDTWSQSFIKVTNDEYDNLYFVTSSGRLMARYANDTKYQNIETNGKFVVDVLVGDDKELYMTERGGGIYKRDKKTGKWVTSKFSATSFGVDYNGNIYGVVGSEVQGIVSSKWSKISVENPNVLDASGNTAITAAVLLGDENGVKTAIESGTNINATNRSGDLPIILAVKSQNLAMTNILVMNKADLNIKDPAGHTPLYYAVNSGNKALVQSILSGEVDPNLEDVVTPVVERRDKEVLILLASYQANLQPGLMKAAEINDAEMFRVMIDYGTKLTSNAPFNLAVDQNNSEIARLSLENGADSKTALDYAIQKNNTDMIGLCLQNGAPESAAIKHAVKTNNSDLALQLIEKYGVNANRVLDEALPGSKANTTTSAAANLEIAAIALQSGAKPNGHFKYAVVSNNSELAELLLATGGSPDILLSESVMNNNANFVSMAIDNGADVSKDKNLLKAIESDYTQIAVLLIARGTPVGNARLISTAVEKSNYEVVKLLLENGAPTADNKLIKTAVNNNQEKIVQELLTYGADPNAAILAAVEKDYTNMVVMMLDMGATATDPQLIAKSSVNGNVKIVTELLNRGADPDAGVLGAINGGKVAIFNLLMEKGANATKEDYVVAAVRRNQAVMFKYMVERGAAVSYQSAKNETLLHFACQNDSYEIAEVLLSKGVDVNQKNSEGQSALHIAANVGRNNLDLCTLLVDNGADVNSKDNRGKSVLKVADGKKLKDYLKSKGATK